MLKGDLATTPVPDLLRQLAAEAATGGLHVEDRGGDEALVYFRDGLVYALSVPGRRPQLGARLVSSAVLAPEALYEALEAQRTELQGWRLGELLVHLGYVDQPVVENFVNEQVRESCTDLLRWTGGRWKFRKAERTREDVAPPVEVAVLLAEVAERQALWETIAHVVHGPTAVPRLSPGVMANTELSLDADAWALLCKVDGERSVAELARACGFTLFEAGRVVYSLVQAGLLDVEEEPSLEPAGDADLTDRDDQTADQTPPAIASALIAALRPNATDAPIDTGPGTELTPDRPEPAHEPAGTAEDRAHAVEPTTAADDTAEPAATPQPAPEPAATAEDVQNDADRNEVPDSQRGVVEPVATGQEDAADYDVAGQQVDHVAVGQADHDAVDPRSPVAWEPSQDKPYRDRSEEDRGQSIESVSSALNDLLGPLPEDADPFGVAQRRIPLATGDDDPPPVDAEHEARRERLRAAAAAELSAAFAAAEAERWRPQGDDEMAPVVDLDTRRGTERRAEETVEAPEDETVDPGSVAPVQTDVAVEPYQVDGEAISGASVDLVDTALEPVEVDAGGGAAEVGTVVGGEPVGGESFQREVTQAAEADPTAMHDDAVGHRSVPEVDGTPEATNETVGPDEAAENLAWLEAATDDSAAESDGETIGLAPYTVYSAGPERPPHSEEWVAADWVTAPQGGDDPAAAGTEDGDQAATTAPAGRADYYQGESSGGEAERSSNDLETQRAATALLGEISKESLAPIEAEPIEEDEPVPPTGPEPELAYAGSTPSLAHEQLDTAALLRELSSLGLEDEGAAPPARPPVGPPRPSHRAASGPEKVKRRRGLFGRG